MKLNILLSSLAATALAVPAGKLVTHESRDTLAVGYQKVGPIDRSSRIPVRIALQQRNLENAMDLLLKVHVFDSSITTVSADNITDTPVDQ